MLLPILTPLLLAATAAHAYKDASPFFLLSSSPLLADAPLKRAQIALASDIENRLIQTLGQCDKKFYYVFSQDGVAANDLKDDGMPKLQKSLSGVDGEGFIGIPDLVADGGLRSGSVQARLEEACSGRGKRVVQSWPEGEDEYQIVEMQLPELPAEKEARSQTLRDTDDAIADTVATVLGGKDASAVLIYLTTPPQPSSHDNHVEMDDAYPSSPHTELKRDFDHHARAQDEDMQAGLPLFERYQFLSPPLFMGLSVSLLLLFILYIGLSAIAGLEVSYFAFSKEMSGQGGHKKQQ